MDPPIGSVPDSKGAKRQRRSVQVIPKFMHKNNPQTLVSSADCRRATVASRWTLNSVTASAIALSRHRFRVRNSSTEKGASRSTARSVMASAKVTIVVYHLVDGEPQLEKSLAVRGSTDTDPGQRRHITSRTRRKSGGSCQRRPVLPPRVFSVSCSSEHRNAVGKLHGGGSPSRPLRDF